MTLTRRRRIITLVLVIFAIYFIPVAVMFLSGPPSPSGARLLGNIQKLAVLVAGVIAIMNDRRESS